MTILTASVLAAAPAEHVGVASAVNNAVARAAGLLAVAALTAIAGLSGEDYRSSAAFAAGYALAVILCLPLSVEAHRAADRTAERADLLLVDGAENGCA